MASSNRISAACFACLRAPSLLAQPLASTSRTPVATFSTSSTSFNSSASSHSAEDLSSTLEHLSNSITNNELSEIDTETNIDTDLDTQRYSPDTESRPRARGRKRTSPTTKLSPKLPTKLPPYNLWILGPANQYRQPKVGMGPNWISATPFPLNPAFKPPPPLHQSVKNDIWNRHWSNPSQWTVNALSQRYSMNKERVLAVLRLKALEEEWKKQNKPLQVEFQDNMERLLGSKLRQDIEPVLAVQSFDKSSRGPQHEEFHESASQEAQSAIQPALEKEVKIKKGMIRALATGGALPSTKSHSRIVPISLGSRQQTRAPLSITTVSGASYQGAGHAERNTRRAEKRKAKVAQARALAKAKADADAEAKTSPPKIV